MNPKKNKHFEVVIDEYINLLDEQIELPVLIQKANEKFIQHLTDDISYIYKPGETENMFKIFMQIKKYEDKMAQISDEIIGLENTLKSFLSLFKGGKVAHPKKENTGKSKITFLFWLEDGKIMSNR